MNDDTLTFLQGDSQGARRDLIARCYYEAAQGDPKSGPVVFAILLGACAEQVAKLPGELRKITSDFLAAVNAARQLERGVIERQEGNNARVLATFKDETARACLVMQETSLDNKATMLRAEQIQERLNAALARLEEIERELHLLRDDLRKEREADKQTAAVAGKIQSLVEQNQALLKRFGKETRANWITMSLGLGMVLSWALNQSQAPPSAEFGCFALGAGLIQLTSRLPWDSMRRWFRKREKPAAT